MDEAESRNTASNRIRNNGEWAMLLVYYYVIVRDSSRHRNLLDSAGSSSYVLLQAPSGDICNINAFARDQRVSMSVNGSYRNNRKESTTNGSRHPTINSYHDDAISAIESAFMLSGCLQNPRTKQQP